jgi:hypothetical protein
VEDEYGEAVFDAEEEVYVGVLLEDCLSTLSIDLDKSREQRAQS